MVVKGRLANFWAKALTFFCDYLNSRQSCYRKFVQLATLLLLAAANVAHSQFLIPNEMGGLSLFLFFLFSLSFILSSFVTALVVSWFFFYYYSISFYLPLPPPFFLIIKNIRYLASYIYCLGYLCRLWWFSSSRYICIYSIMYEIRSKTSVNKFQQNLIKLMNEHSHNRRLL